MVPSDRAVETVAITAELTPQPRKQSWEIFSKIGDGQAINTSPRVIFHQLIFDEWTSGTLGTPLVRIKVDETKLFWND